jgi:predicted pyridoxine 5'-phosphate oxidase superfamily flavin-nucleotide-binding protein
MGHRFLEIATTPDVEAAQAAHGSRAAYARLEQGPATHDLLTEREADFIAARDSFYMATVSATGWPYIQHRGGPAGFLKVLDERTLGFADFRGNRQYITLGNAAGNDRVALFLMDYPNRRRLKLLGRLVAIDPDRSPELLEKLAMPDYPARVEGGFTIAVQAYDWNCPQHITPRFTPAELTPVLDRIAALEEENRVLRERLAGANGAVSGDSA